MPKIPAAAVSLSFERTRKVVLVGGGGTPPLSISKDEVYFTEHTGKSDKKGRAQCCNVVEKKAIDGFGKLCEELEEKIVFTSSTEW